MYRLYIQWCWKVCEPFRISMYLHEYDLKHNQIFFFFMYSDAGLINVAVFSRFLLTYRHARANTKCEETVTFDLYLGLASPAAVNNLPGSDQ